MDKIKDICEQVFEIRYKPDPTILDRRGTIAEIISSNMKLEHWKILENRVDAYSELSSDRAFVGFKNAGFVTRDAPSKNYFSERVAHFMKCLYENNFFAEIMDVKRVGLLSRYCRPSKEDFSDLIRKYNKYLSLSEKANNVILSKNQARLVDIGGPLNFEDNIGKFNTMSGPMKEDQIQQFFKDLEDAPKVGLYYQIDYWDCPPEKKQAMKRSEVLKKINTFAQSGRERYEDFVGIVLGKDVGNA